MKTLITLFTLITLLIPDVTKIDFGNVKRNSWIGVSANDEKIASANVSYSSETIRLVRYKEIEDQVGPSLMGPIENIDLSNNEKVEVRYRAKGTIISMVMKIDLEFINKEFIFSFENTSGEWDTIQIPLTDFVDLYSDELTPITKKELKNINRLGFRTSNDFTGAYAIEVDYIEFI